jgi:hypothetical protein
MNRCIEALDERARTLAKLRQAGPGITAGAYITDERARSLHAASRDEFTKQWKRTVAALQRAETYYVTADIWEAIATSAASLPADVVIALEHVPATHGWIWLEHPVTLPDAPPLPGNESHATVDLKMRAALWSVGYFENGVPYLTIETFHNLVGDLASKPVIPGRTMIVVLNATLAVQDASLERFMPSYTGQHLELMHYVVRSVVGLFLWIRQTIVVPTAVPLERHAAKRMSRAQIAGDLHVVTLRRKAAEPTAEHGEPVEWSCRWVVSGHWRKQFYPSKDRHEYLWILPFVKGPADKPLKPPDPKVFAVIR